MDGGNLRLCYLSCEVVDFNVKVFNILSHLLQSVLLVITSLLQLQELWFHCVCLWSNVYWMLQKSSVRITLLYHLTSVFVKERHKDSFQSFLKLGSLCKQGYVIQMWLIQVPRHKSGDGDRDTFLSGNQTVIYLLDSSYHLKINQLYPSQNAKHREKKSVLSITYIMNNIQ